SKAQGSFNRELGLSLSEMKSERPPRLRARSKRTSATSWEKKTPAPVRNREPVQSLVLPYTNGKGDSKVLGRSFTFLASQLLAAVMLLAQKPTVLSITSLANSSTGIAPGAMALISGANFAAVDRRNRNSLHRVGSRYRCTST